MCENDIAVATHGLTKIYGGVKRVDDVSLSVRRGEIFGLIGKNGAGKTTLIRMILGIASPSSGSVEIGGMSSPAALAEERRKVGALIEQPAFYPRMTAAGNLKAYSLAVGAHGCDIPALLSLVGLEDTGKKTVRNFSLGMKQRLAIAMALIGDPEILFLDEPVNGLDPTGILQVRELIRRLNEERGTTVVISSHLLGELGRVATAYGVMREGKLVCQVRGSELEEEPERAAVALKDSFAEGTYSLRGSTVKIYSPPSDLPRIGVFFAERGIAVMQLSAERGDLESAFIDML